MDDILRVLAAVAAGLLGLVFTIRLMAGPRLAWRWERPVVVVLATIAFAGLSMT